MFGGMMEPDVIYLPENLMILRTCKRFCSIKTANLRIETAHLINPVIESIGFDIWCATLRQEWKCWCCPIMQEIVRSACVRCPVEFKVDWRFNWVCLIACRISIFPVCSSIIVVPCTIRWVCCCKWHEQKHSHNLYQFCDLLHNLQYQIKIISILFNIHF